MFSNIRNIFMEQEAKEIANDNYYLLEEIRKVLDNGV